MFIFFKFNKEKRLGFKKLTEADLGLSTSHQTHIGLYEGVFTFLQNSDVVKSGILIYNDYCEVLDCSFDRIQNPDGSFRSPKIKIGSDSNNSIVAKIREFAKVSPKSQWYLIWSGLESEELTFWLIRSDSEDYNVIREVLPYENRVYGEEDSYYDKAIEILTQKINNVSISVQKGIEVASQIGDKSKLFKKVDIERAEAMFRSVGKRGEELIAEYLEKQKQANNIQSFDWLNKSMESGAPYDFIIDNKNYVDVKSTLYDFNQYIYFSNQEISFASKKDVDYCVFRVYGMKEENDIWLKKCYQCNPYISTMNSNITNFMNEVNVQKAMLQSLKLGILPENCFNDIQSAIKLG
ncbi:DUF3883 domain-containing protein [Prevotella jejuni]